MDFTLIQPLDSTLDSVHVKSKTQFRRPTAHYKPNSCKSKSKYTNILHSCIIAMCMTYSSAYLRHIDGPHCQSLEAKNCAIFVLFPSLEHYMQLVALALQKMRVLENHETHHSSILVTSCEPILCDFWNREFPPSRNQNREFFIHLIQNGYLIHYDTNVLKNLLSVIIMNLGLTRDKNLSQIPFKKY